MADILSSKFIKKYKKMMMVSLKEMNPNISDEKMEKTIDRMIKKNFKNVPVTLDNNYIGERRETTLISVFDWILKRKPIIAGNGTFYMNQDEAINPIAEMLDNFADSRKAYKKEMFNIDDIESYEYKDLDRSQMNEKINMNSWYGGSGAPSAAFYSKWSGPATTLSAQSVISTATAMFDGFLGDNQVFIDCDELMFWLNSVLDDFHDYGDKLDENITMIEKDVLVNRLYSKVLSTDTDHSRKDLIHDMIESFIYQLSDDAVTFIYYKNNMVDFFDNHSWFRDILKDVLWSCHNYPMIELDKKGEYNGNMKSWIDEVPNEFKDEYKYKHPKDWNKFVSKEYFMDPNNIPDSIKDQVFLIKKYLMKYVFVKYLSFDRIYRLRNFRRSAAVIIDTDSNILTLDIIMRYINSNIIGNETYGRPREYNEYIIINTLTSTITSAIQRTLLFYGEKSNIPEAHRPRFDMKNEFFMSPVIIGDSKKRYISKIKLREGNLLNPPKIDVKGFDFKKSTCSEYSEDRFMKMIKTRIIESDHVDIPGLYKDIKSFEDEIKQSIYNGENQFLPLASVKELAGYANPASEQSVRGYIAWNILYPDNPIEIPSKVSLIKLNIFTLDDIADLERTNPDIYRCIKENIFNDTTGIFVTKKKKDNFKIISKSTPDWRKNIPSEYRKMFTDKTVEDWNDFVKSNSHLMYDYKYRGMQVLAIPRNEKIPEWVLEYADITTMVNSIISPFRPVMQLFGNQTAIEGKIIAGVNRTSEKITNIVKF